MALTPAAYTSSAARQLAKELLWRYTWRHRSDPAKRDICIYSSRRGGSTLLMEILAANRGVTFTDQPFGLFTMSRPNINRLPIFPYGQVYAPDDEELARLREYVDGLRAGTIPANVPWKFWARGLRRTDRMVFKITDAKGLAEWMQATYNVHTVVMTRHPVAQSLSVQRNGWDITGKGLLRNAKFVEDHLSAAQRERCEAIYAAGPSLERHVLDWALENLPLIRGLERHPEWLYLSYEHLVQDPADTVRQLAEHLSLPEPARMLEVAGRPSRSTKASSTDSTVAKIRDGKVNHLLSRWRERVDARQLDACFDLLQELGISLYAKDSPMPNLAAIGRAAATPPAETA